MFPKSKARIQILSYNIFYFKSEKSISLFWISDFLDRNIIIFKLKIFGSWHKLQNILSSL